MTTTEPYTVTKRRWDTVVTLGDVPDPIRCDRLAGYFWGRRVREPQGYVFSPVRGMKFDKAYRAGFDVRGKFLAHPAITHRLFTGREAMQIILLAEAIGA